MTNQAKLKIVARTVWHSTEKLCFQKGKKGKEKHQKQQQSEFDSMICVSFNNTSVFKVFKGTNQP